METMDSHGPKKPAQTRAFREIVLSYFAENGRDLPWRRTRDPYRILVSEFMLQQTQVTRVLPKYEEFLEAFPDFESLAAAPLASVLRRWQGLGYNRRALALKRTAEMVVKEHGGRLPREEAVLRGFPGIGPATAAAVAAFAFGDAHPFLETNIRAAFLHHFFPLDDDVPDSVLHPLAEAALDREDPRTWHYALMDYGSMLKRAHDNPSRRSRHHTRQPVFQGSRRQLRAAVLRVVLDRPGADAEGVARRVAAEAEEVAGGDTGAASPTDPAPAAIAATGGVLEELRAEGFISLRGGGYHPAD